MGKWIYRRVCVYGSSHNAKEIDIPDNAIEIHLFQEKASEVDYFSYVCWLEPVLTCDLCGDPLPVSSGVPLCPICEDIANRIIADRQGVKA